MFSNNSKMLSVVSQPWMCAGNMAKDDGSKFNKLWNVFEEHGNNDKSVSERKYDRSLLNKYKKLKV